MTDNPTFIHLLYHVGRDENLIQLTKILLNIKIIDGQLQDKEQLNRRLGKIKLYVEEAYCQGRVCNSLPS